MPRPLYLNRGPEALVKVGAGPKYRRLTDNDTADSAELGAVVLALR